MGIQRLQEVRKQSKHSWEAAVASRGEAFKHNGFVPFKHKQSMYPLKCVWNMRSYCCIPGSFFSFISIWVGTDLLMVSRIRIWEFWQLLRSPEFKTTPLNANPVFFENLKLRLVSVYWLAWFDHHLWNLGFWFEFFHLGVELR